MGDLMTNSQGSTETENQAEPTEAKNQAEPTGVENQADFDDGQEDELDTAEAEAEAESESDDSSESAASSQKTEAELNQEAINKRIDKLTFEKHEERRKREALEAKLAERDAQDKARTPKKIVIPPMPDAYDPEYQAKLTERDNAIQAKAKADAAAELEVQRTREVQEARQREQREEFRRQTDAMYTSAGKVGIKKEDIQKAEQTVALFVTDPSLAQFILAHEDSALIVNHLASNVQELEKLSKLPATYAAAHIAAKIAPEAKKFKPRKSKAPDPLEIPQGAPAGTGDEFLRGVQFE